MKKGEVEKSICYYVKTAREFDGAKYDSIRLNSIVDNFYNTLSNKLEEKNLNLLKYNIGSLKFEQKRNILPITFSLLRGDYCTYTNTIRIGDIEDIPTINHEMIHMATSFYDRGH